MFKVFLKSSLFLVIFIVFEYLSNILFYSINTINFKDFHTFNTVILIILSLVYAGLITLFNLIKTNKKKIMLIVKKIFGLINFSAFSLAIIGIINFIIYSVNDKIDYRTGICNVLARIFYCINVGYISWDYSIKYIFKTKKKKVKLNEE